VETVNTLFEMKTDKELRADAVAANELRIRAALMGRGPHEVTDRQRRLVELLRGHQGRLQAMPCAELEAKLSCDDRIIRREVRDLVMTFRLPIVASRDAESGGYFFAVTSEERFTYTRQYIQEGRQLFARAAIIRNEFDIAKLLGQTTIDPDAAAGKDTNDLHGK
jgi:hypothetical protein